MEERELNLPSTGLPVIPMKLQIPPKVPWNQEPKILWFQGSHMGRRNQIFGPLAFSGLLAGSWVRSRQLGLELTVQLLRGANEIMPNMPKVY